jgi:hypothetical protein
VTGPPLGLNRRRAVRVPMPATGAPVSVVGAKLLNVSPYGMLVESPMALTPDAVLKFRLVIGGLKTDVEARVAQCFPQPGSRRFGLGLEFTQIDNDVQDRLTDVLAEFQAESGTG